MAGRFFQAATPYTLSGGSYNFLRFTFHAGGWTLSPLYSYMDIIREAINYDTRKTPWLLAAAGLLAAVLLLALCLLVYHLRPTESYHKAIAFKRLEPIIKIAVVFPFSVLIALNISQGIGQHVFVWFVMVLVFSAWVISTAMDFLYRMDIRESLRPRISTGVVLVMLAAMTVIYRFDVFQVDTYLPKENKIESMSVYINSMNGLYSYPYNSVYYQGDSEIKAYLKNAKYEEFDSIYDLAAMGVEAQKENDGFPKLKDGEDLLCFYVKYHLKSGRDVYRYYEVKQDDAALKLMGNIYDSWEYKQQTLPVEFIDAEKITEISLNDIFSANRQVTTSETAMQNIFKTYKSEWESLGFQESLDQQVVGFLNIDCISVQQGSGFENGTASLDITQTLSLPLYEGFRGTRKLLEEAGCHVYTKEDVDKMEKIVVVSSDNNGNTEEFTFSDKEDRMEILAKSVFDQYSNPAKDIYPDYSKSLRIYWKDGAGETKEGVYLSNDLPSCVKKVLKTEN